MKISVIGAGLGGLSAACLLAAKGHQLTVFEKNEKVGGKMNILEQKGFRFDTGPSLLTMPFVLENLFKECGANLKEYLELVPLSPLCKYFYPDGTVFNNWKDKQKTVSEIQGFAPKDAESYSRFLAHTSNLYSKTADAFIFNPLYSFTDLKELDLLSFFSIDAFKTVSDRVNSEFKSPYLRQFFKRFTTYNGSSPFQAPATMNVIPHVEINMGGYYVEGGLYKVAEALHKLALSLGVRFEFNAEISEIMLKSGKAIGLKLKDETKVFSDLVISNSDATETIVRLLPNSKISSRKKEKARHIEPSCSGFVLMLGVDKIYEQLVHHNIYFSGDYEFEFKQIFSDKVMPDDPTIYIANTSYSDPKHAIEDGSNLFILVNAPYISKHYDWRKKEIIYGEKVISELENRGLDELRNHIILRKSITPLDFYSKYYSNKGSIYGTSSNNKFSAFLRPRNKSREIDGLYLVGGSTHPGGGIPLVVQSAFNAVDLIQRFEES